MIETDRIAASIQRSHYISRDLSWIKFNYRVLDQAKKPERTIFEKLKFMAITASNLDEFFMIRVGSLYNYIDYGKERIDYSGLREIPFKKKLFADTQKFFADQSEHYKALKPEFAKSGFIVANYDELKEYEKEKVRTYFKKTMFPMLTPMVYDSYHTFPILMNKIMIFGVVTDDHEGKSERKKLSFIQLPSNLPRFYELERDNIMVFIPIENIVRTFIHKLFRNIEIESVNLLRITRNGDFTLEESDDIDANFLEELRRKLKTRKTGRVVRLDVDENPNKWMLRVLRNRWELEDENIFTVDNQNLFDYTGLFQIVEHSEFKNKLPKYHRPVRPVSYPEEGADDIFEVLKRRDILLHHPYNSVEPLIELLEKSAEDPKVLSMKLTIYRVARDSRITAALLRAAENGKHVSVLFEVKARFDEENNLREAKKLQDAGCFVIYGIKEVKTHTKLCLIVRKEGEKVTRYLHMSSGNYNEVTSRFYSDWSVMTSNEIYAHDISEFFNAITGHSMPHIYQYLITAPKDMRQQVIDLIRAEARNAKKGPSRAESSSK